MQDQVAAAVNSSSSNSSSSSGSSDSEGGSENSNFGLAAEKDKDKQPKRKAAPKRLQFKQPGLAYGAASSSPGKSLTEAPPFASPADEKATAGKGKDASGSKGSGANVKKTTQTEATACLQLLEQLTPAAIWKGALKEKGITARLSKATTCESELMQVQLKLEGSELTEVEDLIKVLKETILNITSMQDLTKQIQASTCILDLVKDHNFAEEATRLFKAIEIESDTLSAILNFLGQKLIEAQGGAS
jgi:hypothetical protein